MKKATTTTQIEAVPYSLMLEFLGNERKLRRINSTGILSYLYKNKIYPLFSAH